MTSALRMIAVLPLSFEPNLGQSDPRVQFLTQGPGYRLFLTSTEAVLKLRSGAAASVVRLRLEGASPASAGTGLDLLPERRHYFLGRDSSRWRSNVPTYARVLWREVYPGIDLVYYGTEGQLEWDLFVRPGADPGRIRLAIDGASSPERLANGDLLLRASAGEVRLGRPLVYQEEGGKRQEVPGRYVVEESGRRVRFVLGAYDPARTLVIDPVVRYSSYLGGALEDAATAVAVDRQGNTYVVGATDSSDFPTASPRQRGLEGFAPDAFVMKLRPDGQGLVYSTFLGGRDFDIGLDVAVDPDGNAYLTGNTASPDFPVVDAVQPTFGGGHPEFPLDAFVAKLSPDGSLLRFSTFLGGSGDDFGMGIALDRERRVTVGGQTTSLDFPTAKPIQPSHGGGDFDAFVARLDAGGRKLLYSTYLGGSGEDAAFGVDADDRGQAYLTGRTSSPDFPTRRARQPALAGGGGDAFVTKLNRHGTAFVYSTFLGGSADDFGNGVKADEDGNAYVGGDTTSADFPTRHPLQATNAGGDDAFVTKLDRDGSRLVYSTYLGGSGVDAAFRIALDRHGRAYVTGVTDSADFPTVRATQPEFGGGPGDGLLAVLSRSGERLAFSTYLGGGGDEIGFGLGADREGVAHVVGVTTSDDFPTRDALQPTFAGGPSDGFLTKISPGGTDDEDDDDDDDDDEDDRSGGVPRP